MSRKKAKAVECQISAGGFSGERVVRVPTFDGKEHLALAPRDYCWKHDESLSPVPLAPDEPEVGKQIGGLVAARIEQEENGIRLFVSLPDGSAVWVKADMIVDRPELVESNENVPLRS